MWPWLIAGLVGWLFKDKIAEAVAPKPKYAPTPLPAPGGGASLVPSPTPGYAPYVAPTPAPEANLQHDPGFDGSTWGTKLYPPVPVQPQVPQPQTPHPPAPPKPTTPCPTGQEWACIGTLLPGAGCSWRCISSTTGQAPGTIFLKPNESGPQICGWIPAGTNVVIEACPPGQVRESMPVAAMACVKGPGSTAYPDPRVGVGRCVAEATLTAPGQVGTPTAPRPGLACTKIGYTVPAWIRPKCPARTGMRGLGVPANPTPRNTTQPDGTAIVLRLVGDEWCHYTTSNGFPVVQRADGFWVYAKPNPSDTAKLVGTGLVVGRVCPHTIAAKVQAGA